MQLSNLLLFSCVVLAFFIGNIWSINITQSVKISLLDITIASGLVLNFRHIKLFNKPLIFFILIDIFSLVFSGQLFANHQILIGSLYLLRFGAYSCFFASNIWSLKVDQINTIVHSLGLSVIVTGIAQYVFYPDIRSLAYLQWDQHLYRVVGTFLDPGFVSLLLILYLLFLLIRPVKNKGLQWVLVVSGYLAMALTYSRSGYLAWLMGTAFIAWKIRGWRFFAAILLLLTVTVAVLPRSPDGEGVKLERSNSIYARIDSWQKAIKIFGMHPVIGVGFNNYRYAQNKYGMLTDPKWQVSHAGAGADSSLLFVAATTGILGLAAYLWYLRDSFKHGDLVVQTSLVAVLAHSLFLNSLFYPPILVWLGLIGLRSRLSHA